MAGQEVYEFAEFALDVTERRLLQGNRVVPLAPKAFDLLVVFVRHAGRLVTKQDLLDLAWPDAHVEEGILSVHVSNPLHSNGFFVPRAESCRFWRAATSAVQRRRRVERGGRARPV